MSKLANEAHDLIKTSLRSLLEFAKREFGNGASQEMTLALDEVLCEDDNDKEPDSSINNVIPFRRKK